MLIGMCGHFGFGRSLLNGQTIKTKIVSKELERAFGPDRIYKVDSHGGARRVPGLLLDSLRMFRSCHSIVFCPGQKGIRILTPAYGFYNLFFRRKLYYVVIGGWLAEFLDRHPLLCRIMKSYAGIYVESKAMRRAMEEKGFQNVSVMPNFKQIQVLTPSDFQIFTRPPYPVCTFSRVMKEKGIEAAVAAVRRVNEEAGEILYELKIFGQIEHGYEEAFDQLKQGFPDYISYEGMVPFDQSTQVLKDYFALLFPSFYEGEGQAGTLVDAMSAGLPVIASNWRFNSEFVKDGVNGCLLPPLQEGLLPDEASQELERQLCKVLPEIAGRPQEWNQMKESCLREIRKYQPEEAMKDLVDQIKNKEA